MPTLAGTNICSNSPASHANPSFRNDGDAEIAAAGWLTDEGHAQDLGNTGTALEVQKQSFSFWFGVGLYKYKST